MTSDMLKQAIERAAATVRQTNPLTPSITNTVTINFVANAQLAVGGSAAMVYLPDEGEGLARICDAMYINVGTLFPIYAETLPKTAKTLHEEQKTWVLDPVAIGLGKMRTDLLTQFKEYKPSIIRGNASEIIALAGLWNVSGGSAVSDVRGVDSTGCKRRGYGTGFLDGRRCCRVWERRFDYRWETSCPFPWRVAHDALHHRDGMFPRRCHGCLCCCR